MIANSVSSSLSGLCLLCWVVVLSSLYSSVSAAEDSAKWAIAVHGGAGKLPQDFTDEQEREYQRALRAALTAGKTILAQGGQALDAVEAAVIVLENEPVFNAGKGAVFTREGRHELDASIMDGGTLRCGAVAGVTRVKNPILAARAVMERTPHILLSGVKADEFASHNACESVEQSYFYTPGRFQQLQEKLAAKNLPQLDAPAYPMPFPTEGSEGGQLRIEPLEPVGGTVGCVARDSFGNLAAATSTGGLTGKMPGRIGDTPVIGAGNFANQSVAASGTGKGEEFIRHSVTAQLAWLVESGNYSLEEAVSYCLNHVLQPGDGGLIAVDAKGNLALQTNTGIMSRGAADSSGRFEVAIEYPVATK